MADYEHDPSTLSDFFVSETLILRKCLPSLMGKHDFYMDLGIFDDCFDFFGHFEISIAKNVNPFFDKKKILFFLGIFLKVIGVLGLGILRI